MRSARNPHRKWSWWTGPARDTRSGAGPPPPPLDSRPLVGDPARRTLCCRHDDEPADPWAGRGGLGTPGLGSSSEAGGWTR